VKASWYQKPQEARRTFGSAVREGQNKKHLEAMAEKLERNEQKALINGGEIVKEGRVPRVEGAKRQN